MPAKPPIQFMLIRRGKNKGGLVNVNFETIAGLAEYALESAYGKQKIKKLVKELSWPVLNELKYAVDIEYNKREKEKEDKGKESKSKRPSKKKPQSKDNDHWTVDAGGFEADSQRRR